MNWNMYADQVSNKYVATKHYSPLVFPLQNKTKKKINKKRKAELQLLLFICNYIRNLSPAVVLFACLGGCVSVFMQQQQICRNECVSCFIIK